MGKKPSGDGSKKISWSNKILEDLFEQRGQKVDIKKDSDINMLLQTDRSKFYEIQLDSKNKINIACPPEKLLENVNQALLQTQTIALFLGDYSDFEEWFEDFVLEFRKNLPSTKQLPTTELKPWGQSYEQRPKKLNLLPLEEFLRLGKQKILFYPDRTKEETILFEGTYYELRRQLLSYMRNGSNSQTLTASKGISERKHLSGHPKITLVFRQISVLNVGQTAGMESKLSLTLTDYSEYEDGYGLKVLSINDLKIFANKIKSLFLEPELFKLERGREGYSYQDWRRGYGAWSNFLNKESALAFYQRYVQIKGDTFNSKYIGDNPHTFKEDKQEDVQILNETTKLPKRYQKATLALWVAFCHLPVSDQKIILVSRSSRQPVDERILA